MGITQYAKETRTELQHVSWPTRGQAIAYTVLVVVLSLHRSHLFGCIGLCFEDCGTENSRLSKLAHS